MIIPESERNPPLHKLNAEQREYERAIREKAEDAASLAKLAIESAFADPLSTGKRTQKPARSVPT